MNTVQDPLPVLDVMEAYEACARGEPPEMARLRARIQKAHDREDDDARRALLFSLGHVVGLLQGGNVRGAQAVLVRALHRAATALPDEDDGGRAA